MTNSTTQQLIYPPKPWRRWNNLTTLLLAWLLGLAAASAQVTFEAQVESPEVVQGSRFEVAFVLKNADGGRFKAPDLGGLRAAGGVSEMFGSSITNDRPSAMQIVPSAAIIGDP